MKKFSTLKNKNVDLNRTPTQNMCAAQGKPVCLHHSSVRKKNETALRVTHILSTFSVFVYLH